MLASEYTVLDELVGKQVKALVAFFKIPEGTIGTVVNKYTIGPKETPHEGIMVEWRTSDGDLVQDGFSKDGLYNELDYLEVIK